MINNSNIINNLEGNERTRKIRKNIYLSIFLKIGNAVCIFLLVPLTIKYLDALEYGIWITMTSIITWVGMFDIGIGNGLKNKLAEAFALNDKVMARNYVSTSYFIFSMIAMIFIIFLTFINAFVDLNIVFNAPNNLKTKVNKLVFILFILFSFQFILKLILTILIADQKVSLSELFYFFVNLLSLISVWILVKSDLRSILNLGIVMGSIPVVLLIIASIFFFSKTYNYLSPRWSYVKFEYMKNLGTLGIKFFIIQLSWLLIFSSSNMILTQLLGPASVTPFNVVYRYFSIITIFFTIILNPIWVGFTDAYFKEDFNWIKNTIKTLKKIMLIFIGVTIFLVIFSNTFFDFWLGNQREFDIPDDLIVFMAIYVILLLFMAPFNYFINGVGKIKLQFYLSLINLFFNIPISIINIKYFNMGISGVVVGSIVSLLPFVVLIPIQYQKILKKKAVGIWNQ